MSAAANTASLLANDGDRHEKRYGLIPARIGASFIHRIGIEMPLDAPRYRTVTDQVGSRARTSLNKTKSHIGFAGVPGHTVAVPVKALPGAPVELVVQDISRLDRDLVEKVKWVCLHPDCRGHKHESRDALFESHADNRELIDEAKRDPRGGQAHVYYGVLEIPGVAASPAGKDGKAVPAVEPILMLLSDEV